MSDEEKIYTRDKMKQKTVYPTEQTPSYADWALYEMGKDLEDKVDEQSGGAEYTAGSGISISEENVISNTAQPDVTKSYVDNADLGLQQQIDAVVASSDVKDIVGTYADLQAYDTSTLGNNDIIKVLTDSTHNNATGYYRWVITQDVGAWTYIGSEGPYYTKSEADTLLLDKLNKNFNNADVGQATAGQVLKVNASANGVEFGDVPNELPTISSGDAGKVLAVNSGETGTEWITPEVPDFGIYLKGTSASAYDIYVNGKQVTYLQFYNFLIAKGVNYRTNITVLQYNTEYFSGVISSLRITTDNMNRTYVEIKFGSGNNYQGVYAYCGEVLIQVYNTSISLTTGNMNRSIKIRLASGNDGLFLKSKGNGTTEWATPSTGIPSISSGDAGKVLSVNSGETGVEWSNPAGGLPASTSSDEGKVLTVDSQGDAAWDDVPKELPAIASGDAGKVLAVNSGETGVEWVTPSGGGKVPVSDWSDLSDGDVFIGKITYDGAPLTEVQISGSVSYISSSNCTFEGIIIESSGGTQTIKFTEMYDMSLYNIANGYKL